MQIEKKKILYHGTAISHDMIDLNKGGDFKDFGRGYYLTSSLQQANDWATKKGSRSLESPQKCWIYAYSIQPIPETFKVRELLEYNVEWLNFVTACRIDGTDTDFDIIYDRMADNQYKELTETIRNYGNKEISPEVALERIRFKSRRNRDQYCFKTERAIALLNRTKTFEMICGSNGEWHNVDEEE